MHDVAGEVLGVNPQVVFVGKRQENRFGGGSQTDGDGGAVLDEPRGDQPRNPFGGIEFRGCSDRDQRFVVLDDDVHVVRVDEAPPQNPRHAGIDLGDDEVRGLGRSQRDVHRDPQAHPSEIIRRRDLDQGHVDRQQAALEEPRHGRQVDGGQEALVAGDGVGLGGAGVERADVERVVPALVGDQGERGGFQIEEPDDFDVLQRVEGIRKLPHQMLGLST